MAAFAPARKKGERRAREGRRSERERVREAERELGRVPKR
jgi:hypothetical protein